MKRFLPVLLLLAACSPLRPAAIIVPPNSHTDFTGKTVAGFSGVGTPQDFPPSADSNTIQCKGRKDVGVTIVPCVQFKNYAMSNYTQCQYGTLTSPLPPRPTFPAGAYCTYYSCAYNEELNGDVLHGAIGRLSVLFGMLEASLDCSPPYKPYPVCMPPMMCVTP